VARKPKTSSGEKENKSHVGKPDPGQSPLNLMFEGEEEKRGEASCKKKYRASGHPKKKKRKARKEQLLLTRRIKKTKPSLSTSILDQDGKKGIFPSSPIKASPLKADKEKEIRMVTWRGKETGYSRPAGNFEEKRQTVRKKETST